MKHSRELIIFIALGLLCETITASTAVFWHVLYPPQPEPEYNETAEETTTIMTTMQSDAGEINLVQVGANFISSNIAEYSQIISNVTIHKRSTDDFKSSMRERAKAEIERFETSRYITIQNILNFVSERETQVLHIISQVKLEAAGYADFSRNNFYERECFMADAFIEYNATVDAALDKMKDCMDNQENAVFNIFDQVVEFVGTLFAGSYNYTDLIEVCDKLPPSWNDLLSSFCYRDMFQKIVRDFSKLDVEGVQMFVKVIDLYNLSENKVNECGNNVGGKIDMAGLVLSVKSSDCE